jgi:hypothetical protein
MNSNPIIFPFDADEPSSTSATNKESRIIT